MRTITEILDSNNCQYSFSQEENIQNAMEEYGIQMYNQAIDDAVKNVTASMIQSSVNESKRAIVNKNTILNLKK